ncbi:MAG: YkgJ family cysteine cluster protein [Desulfobacteraceae bacterium]|jgi:Fe-S-cluster containining protein
MNSGPQKENEKSGATSEDAKEKPISECRRCGTCCRKGGPAFHRADKALIEKGVIHSKYLYTIRKGELAYDNIRQRLEPVSSDVIKLKGKGKSWTCILFDEKQNACTIYDNRPIQCRALKCWDTKAIEDLYAQKRLQREDLIADIEGLWGLIKDHQARCNYEAIQKLVDAINSDRGEDARQKLAEIIQFDIEIRKLVVSRGGLDVEMLDFLFGRPLKQTLRNFGLKVLQKEKKTIEFLKDGKSSPFF